MNFIDRFLDSITMYRLMLYYLIGLLIVSLLLSAVHILPFSSLSLIVSVGFLTIVCLAANEFFSIAFDAPTNNESAYISALILALIITPIASFQDVWLFFWAGVLAMSTKYILAIHKKHIFNPVAIAVVLTAIGINGAASWWVGTSSLAPFVLVGGILIVRKIKRANLLYSFIIASLATSVLFAILSGGDVFKTVTNIVLNSSLLFLGFVMLTEPLTTPPTKKMQILYGAFVGILSAPQLKIAGMYSTPELALSIGNIFSYAVSPKYKLLLRLKQKIQYGADVFDYQFFLGKKLSFVPGQYMEWTLTHENPDARGNRRYFTIASSPTEDALHLGIKFYPQGSSFKKTLASLDANIPIVGAQLSGEFTLPKNPAEKCVLIAGGIGITPFRSMIKYLIDTNQPRPITLFYANKMVSEIAYREIFDEARKRLGINTVYTLTDKNKIPKEWKGKVGRIDAHMIQEEVPDYQERTYYLSGPHAMVTANATTLQEMGIPKSKIKTDYFPGFA